VGLLEAVIGGDPDYGAAAEAIRGRCEGDADASGSGGACRSTCIACS